MVGSFVRIDNSIRSGVGVLESRVFNKIFIDNFKLFSIVLFSIKSVFKILLPA